MLSTVGALIITRYIVKYTPQTLVQLIIQAPTLVVLRLVIRVSLLLILHFFCRMSLSFSLGLGLVPIETPIEVVGL